MYKSKLSGRSQPGIRNWLHQGFGWLCERYAERITTRFGGDFGVKFHPGDYPFLLVGGATKDICLFYG